jgi:hypothetical protein
VKDVVSSVAQFFASNILAGKRKHLHFIENISFLFYLSWRNFDSNLRHVLVTDVISAQKYLWLHEMKNENTKQKSWMNSECYEFRCLPNSEGYFPRVIAAR